MLDKRCNIMFFKHAFFSLSQRRRPTFVMQQLRFQKGRFAATCWGLIRSFHFLWVRACTCHCLTHNCEYLWVLVNVPWVVWWLSKLCVLVSYLRLWWRHLWVLVSTCVSTCGVLLRTWETLRVSVGGWVRAQTFFYVSSWRSWRRQLRMLVSTCEYLWVLVSTCEYLWVLVSSRFTSLVVVLGFLLGALRGGNCEYLWSFLSKFLWVWRGWVGASRDFLWVFFVEPLAKPFVNTCEFLWVLVSTCEYLWVLVSTYILLLTMLLQCECRTTT